MIQATIFMLIGALIHALKSWQKYDIGFPAFMRIKYLDFICAVVLAWVILLSDYDPISPIYAFTVGYSSDSAMRYLIDRYSEK